MGAIKEAIQLLKERRYYCEDMANDCCFGQRPELSARWSLKAEECRKAIKVLREIKKRRKK